MAKKINDEIQYKLAISLLEYEGNALWAKFNSMLIANSILLGIIGLLVLNSKKFNNIEINFFILLFAGSGLIICILWLLLIRRGFNQQYLYHNFAKSIESNEYSQSLINSCQQKGLSAKYISYGVIIVFLVLYLLITFSSLVHLTCRISFIFLRFIL